MTNEELYAEDLKENGDHWSSVFRGLPIVAIRGTSGLIYGGHWCGYIGVPRGLSEYGSKDVLDLEGLDSLHEYAHGGVTYSSPELPNGISFPTDHWWFGFTCAHASDWVPKLPGMGGQYKGQYKGLDFVIGVLKDMALHLSPDVSSMKIRLMAESAKADGNQELHQILSVAADKASDQGL